MAYLRILFFLWEGEMDIIINTSFDYGSTINLYNTVFSLVYEKWSGEKEAVAQVLGNLDII